MRYAQKNHPKHFPAKNLRKDRGGVRKKEIERRPRFSGTKIEKES